MNHLPLIIKREYVTKIRNRSFIIMTFVSPLIMIVLISVVAYLTQLNNEKRRTISILDESGLFSDVFQNTDNTTYSYLQVVDLEMAKAIVKESNGYGLMHIKRVDPPETVPSDFKFYSEDSPSLTVISSLENKIEREIRELKLLQDCLLYTSPSPRDKRQSRMPSSA